MTPEIEARFRGTQGGLTLDIDFTCPVRGVTGLFGPSGAGKTTILRCMAGLIRFGHGYLRIGDDVWQDKNLFVLPHRRAVGFVFQEPRLLPHLPVLGNLRYGLSRARPPHQIAFDDVVDLLGIAPLLERSTANLSGGERQRIAIGRALLSQPRILLMDEPLSALDRDAKLEILPYLERLAGSLPLPIIYVTHDMTEIERLADHLLVLNRNGGIVSSGPLVALLTDLDQPLAHHPDAATVLDIQVRRHDPNYDVTECALGNLTVFVPGTLGAPGETRRLRIKAGDVSLFVGQPQKTSVLNVLPATIRQASPVGTSQMLVLLTLDTGGPERLLLSSITRKSWDGLGFAPGMQVLVQFKGMALANRS